MNGEWHYGQAERLADEARKVRMATGFSDHRPESERLAWHAAYVAEAQVHATLAAAANGVGAS